MLLYYMVNSCGYNINTSRCNKQSKYNPEYCSTSKTNYCMLSDEGKLYNKTKKLSTKSSKNTTCKGKEKNKCQPPNCYYVDGEKRKYCRTQRHYKYKTLIKENQLDTVGLEIKSTIDSIEKFVTQMTPSLSEQNKLRAIIICFSDRYGAGKCLDKIANFKPVGFNDQERKQLFSLCLECKKWNKKLRTSLASRTDRERVQMQRPIHGKSLLALVVPYDPRYGIALNALLVTSFHPKFGISELKSTYSQYQALPFKIPAKLQPTIPKLEKTNLVDAEKINKMIQDIYLVREGKSPKTYKSVKEFVERLKLHDDDNWQRFGELPKLFNQSCQFKCEVPDVHPGKQIILWKTWHTTTGYAKSSNMVGFIDLVPISYLTSGELLWYHYWCSYAPCDPGGGQARGTWQMMTHKIRKQATHFGLQSDIMKKWIKNPKKQRITATQMQSFHDKGYLVLDIPESLQQKCNVKNILENNNDFFRTITGDHEFDFSKLDSIQRSEVGSLAEKKMGNKYFYYVDKIDVTDPLNPDATTGKSHNAQKGGKLIAADSGMGPSTYTNEPIFVEFEFSNFIAEIMASFYGKVKMVPVLERFRVKSRSVWKSGTHVDIVGDSLIPESVKQLFAANEHLLNNEVK